MSLLQAAKVLGLVSVVAGVVLGLMIVAPDLVIVLLALGVVAHLLDTWREVRRKERHARRTWHRDDR